MSVQPDEPSDWRLRVFTGGAVNWALLLALVRLAYSFPQYPLLYFLPVFSVMLFPIWLSLVLTKEQPKKKIVPPHFIDIITGTWLILTYFVWPVFTDISLFLVLIMFAGVIHNLGTALFLGREGKENIKQYSFVASASRKRISDLLSDVSVQRALGVFSPALQSKPQIEKGEHSIVYRTVRQSAIQFYIQIADIEEEGGKYKSDVAQINLLFFEKTRYSIIESSFLAQFINRQIPYLRSVLADPSDKGNAIILVQADNSNSQNLLELAWRREGRRATERLDVITNQAWAKIVLLALSFVIPIYLYFGAHSLTSALETVAVITISIAVASADEVLKIRRRNLS